MKQVVNLLNIAGKLRPKYTEDIKAFTSEYISHLNDAIEKRDWIQFEKLIRSAIDASNVYHEKYGYGFIRYLLPKTPPEHLDLGPNKK